MRAANRVLPEVAWNSDALFTGRKRCTVSRRCLLLAQRLPKQEADSNGDGYLRPHMVHAPAILAPSQGAAFAGDTWAGFASPGGWEGARIAHACTMHRWCGLITIQV